MASLSAFTGPQIEADFVAILLKAANADLPPNDLPTLTRLFYSCMSGDLVALEEFSRHPNPRIGSEARHILRQHSFNKERRELSVAPSTN